MATKELQAILGMLGSQPAQASHGDRSAAFRQRKQDRGQRWMVCVTLPPDTSSSLHSLHHQQQQSVMGTGLVGGPFGARLGR